MPFGIGHARYRDIRPLTSPVPASCRRSPGVELELELIQSNMAQKPVLRGEVDARALRVPCAHKSDRGWVVQASAVSEIGLGVGIVSPCGPLVWVVQPPVYSNFRGGLSSIQDSA